MDYHWIILIVLGHLIAAMVTIAAGAKYDASNGHYAGSEGAISVILMSFFLWPLILPVLLGLVIFKKFNK